MTSKALTRALTTLEQEVGGPKSRITVEDMVEALNHKGFGYLLLAPSLLTILPTGALPGVPAICGFLIFLVSAQILFDRHYPWLPRFVKNLSVDSDKLASAIAKAKPAAKKIDRYIHPRFEFMSKGYAQKLIAALCCLLGIFMVMIGFIPFAPMIISLPILLLALGVSAKDGLFVLLGVGMTGLSATLLIWVMP